MTQTIWREGFVPTLPSKANGAAELTVPKPAAITREPRYFGAIRTCDWVSPSLTIHQAGKKGGAVLGNFLQFFVRCGLAADVVGRPASLERRTVTGQALSAGPDEFQSGWHLRLATNVVSNRRGRTSPCRAWRSRARPGSLGG